MFLVEYGPAMSAMSGKGTNVFFFVRSWRWTHGQFCFGVEERLQINKRYMIYMIYIYIHVICSINRLYINMVIFHSFFLYVYQRVKVNLI